MAAADQTAVTNRDYAIGLIRAFAGAIIFAIPLLMTMEMWALGFTMDPVRLLLFMLLNFAVLLGLTHFAGFEATHGLRDALCDALAAYAVGVIASAGALALIGIVAPGMPWGEIAGKIAVQAIPASIGAVVARRQLSADSDDEEQAEKQRRAGYLGQLFLMAAGALFLAFNVAPTEEMILIAFKMTPWHGLATIIVSVLVLHAFVYVAGFSGQEEIGEAGHRATFLTFSIAGYGVALLVSLYVLWTFGRTDGVSIGEVATMVAVLGLPASLGAAIARLIV
ncbi:TIGR02587 family membrane protein [Sphingoaurantiacus capsulatus]|uniref:TIGR02587 family membrane protein n=1 Tax=Sphingoaurantiacus capsulatus TaxID=1771310 RepID=A0ABV7X6N2_9SPHN